LGNANTTLYELGTANDALPYHFYHQRIPGYNGVVTVKAGTKGYNQITGLGTPYAANFIGAPNLPLAGDPQTPSNP
ncbi:MAG: peptidase S53, partial [Candidatus Eremiobacteraeota bacterium]|nr:peptidase S53 [Candidatus Eremiobacteraeota bacterium]